jgi:hypothetical protein
MRNKKSSLAAASWLLSMGGHAFSATGQPGWLRAHVYPPQRRDGFARFLGKKIRLHPVVDFNLTYCIEIPIIFPIDNAQYGIYYK